MHYLHSGALLCSLPALVVVILGPLRAEQPNPGRVVLECKGYVQPARQVTVSPKVGGQIVEMHIEEGKRVKAGDVLAKIDPAEYEAARLIAQAQLKLAEAELIKAKEAGNKADLTIAQAKVELARPASTWLAIISTAPLSARPSMEQSWRNPPRSAPRSTRRPFQLSAASVFSPTFKR